MDKTYMNGGCSMDADLSCLVLTCSTPLAHTNGEGWWRRAEALVTITTIASGPTWDVDGRDGALVITHPGRKVDSLGCSEGDKTHTRSQAGLHCVWPQFSIGVRRGVWAAETAAAARCLRFHMLASLLAWPGKAGQMIRSGLVAGSADR